VKKLSFVAITFFFVFSPASAWSLFGPSSYEDCAKEAASEAATKDGLNVMLIVCNDQFPARLGPDGKYRYYDAHIGDYVSVSGPKLSQSDWRKIKAARDKYDQAKADLEERMADYYKREEEEKRFRLRRNQKALGKVSVDSWTFGCGSYTSICPDKHVSVRIKNGSDYEIAQIQIGVLFPEKGIGCSGTHFPITNSLNVTIPPGGTASETFVRTDGNSSRNITGCIAIKSVVVSD